MKRRSSLYIKDILDAMTKIQEFTKDMSFDEFIKDDFPSLKPLFLKIYELVLAEEGKDAKDD